MDETRWSTVGSVSLAVILHGALGLLLVWTAPFKEGRQSPSDGRAILITMVEADRGSAAAAAAVLPSTSREVRAVDSITEPPSPALSDAPAPAPAQVPDVAAGEKATASAEVGDPNYQRLLLSHIQGFRRYPDAARRNGQQGVVLVRFLMSRDGKVIDAWVDQSSGVAILDAEALSAVLRAQPLPPPPPPFPDRLAIALPVSFSLR